jgi:hypothetical protein
MPGAANGISDPSGAGNAAERRAVKVRFDVQGVRYDLRRQHGAGTRQLIRHDPSGAKVELDFDPSETP